MLGRAEQYFQQSWADRPASEQLAHVRASGNPQSKLSPVAGFQSITGFSLRPNQSCLFLRFSPSEVGAASQWAGFEPWSLLGSSGLTGCNLSKPCLQNWAGENQS